MLSEFFDERKTKLNWLHRGAVYDTAVFLLGLPLAIWGDFRLSEILARVPTMPLIISSAIYVYVFMFALNLFRLVFLYSKWVFPKVELETQRVSSPLRHRTAWVVITLPIVTAFIYDVLKFLFAN